LGRTHNSMYVGFLGLGRYPIKNYFASSHDLLTLC
jgi:hypothetical protein